jgi:hypothetical protein|tara:strand:- start:79 stop:543 length:465 start_codon:yes stop_codon:yes gene_type:complete
MEIELFNNKLKVFECGKILILGKRKPNKDEYYEKKFIIKKGYKRINLCHEGKQKHYTIHRIIAYTYLGLDINNPKKVIDHINRDKLDNQVSNLRVVSQQQNQFNTKAKGYYKHINKYEAKIQINGKKICLGTYETETEAHNAYLIAKQIHHIIN